MTWLIQELESTRATGHVSTLLYIREKNEMPVAQFFTNFFIVIRSNNNIKQLWMDVTLSII